MAKYTVKHSCGCEREYQLFGKHTERDRKTEWLESQPCLECKRKAEEEEAQKATEGMELPALEGTPKQVAWANTLRGQLITRLAVSIKGTELACQSSEINNVFKALLPDLPPQTEEFQTTKAHLKELFAKFEKDCINFDKENRTMAYTKSAQKLAIEALSAIASSSWFIDNRGKSAGTLIAEAWVKRNLPLSH